MHPLRFGLLGAAKIAPHALITPAREIEGVEVIAVAARDRDRAEAFAAEYGIPEVSEDYAALVTRPDIDAVYNALPPSGHAPWTIRALEAGKHVLCEKPFCLDTGEATRMVDTAERNGRVLCEAFHDRYHPLAERICEIVRGDELGALQRIEGSFSVPIPDETDLRHQVELGGGATMDLGCYPIHQILTVAGCRGTPTRTEVVRAEAREGKPGIDLEMHAELLIDGHVEAHVDCSMAPDVEFGAKLVVTGSQGRLEVMNPIHPHFGHSVRLVTGSDDPPFVVEGRSTYHHQLEAFLAAVSQGRTLPTGGADAIATMRVLEAVYERAGLPPRG